MKKICITLVAAATLFTLSCKKEDNQPSNTNKPNSGISEADAKLERSLQNFISKVKNYNTNNAKTRTASDAYSLDSTEFYLETALNYDHRYIPTDYDKEYSNETTFSILKNADGTVDFNNIANAFTSLNGGIDNYLNSIAESSKDMVYADLIRKEINEGTMLEYTLRTGYVGKTAAAPITNHINPFSIGWKAGNFEGNLLGQFITLKDATTELSKYCNMRTRNLLFYGDDGNSQVIAGLIKTIYYSQVARYYTFPYVLETKMPTQPTPLYPYRLWRSDTPINGSTTDIPANYMNFFYKQSLNIVVNNPGCLSQLSVNKKLIGLNYGYNVDSFGNYHDLEISFGFPHFSHTQTQ